MDHMFPFVGMRRVKVQIELEYVSVSEDELVEDKYYVWLNLYLALYLHFYITYVTLVYIEIIPKSISRNT